MPQQPFHHGNLRAVLLDQAEDTLRTHGADGLSLRELARRAGVSHGAPRSHFVDRQALLDADAHPDDLVRRLRAVADAYVCFAVTDAGLLELMFSNKTGNAPEAVQAAAGQLFATFDAMFEADLRAGRFRLPDFERTKLLFVAVMQGVAALAASGRVSPEQAGTLLDDGIALLTGGETSNGRG